MVVVLGHVDHGKSSLLEAIKDFKITAKESGGITQHIGAYEVEHNGHTITFLDTPGHEAFSAMRERGAHAADIALLVVDAAQGVQPQTKEAIAAARKADVPMIVVLNKIDLPTADPNKIKGELAKVDVSVESYGGDVPSVEVSAKEKRGINELLEMINLVADLHELKSDTTSPAEGLVIESYMDQLKGPVATVIVEKGILNKKSIIATDSAVAKVRSLENFQGKPADEFFPSQPAVVLGFQAVPGVGERFKEYSSIEEAEQVVKKAPRAASTRVFGESMEGKKVLNIILKSDVAGSLEAIEKMLAELPQDQVAFRVVKSEVGDITESDVALAQTMNADIIGFRVKITPVVSKMLSKETKKRVTIKNFNIIYELVQGVRASMEKSLEAETVRVELGRIKALVIFFGEKNRQIVGGKITDGEIKKGMKLEVFRDNQKIGNGKIINLQRDKKDADVLKKGSECGILFEGNVKVEKNDVLVAVTEEKRKGVL